MPQITILIHFYQNNSVNVVLDMMLKCAQLGYAIISSFKCRPEFARIIIVYFHKVETQHQPPKHNLSLTVMEVRQAELFKKVKSKQNRVIYQIDLIFLPYLFSFNSQALRACKLSDQTKNSNPVAFQLFHYLKTKILPKRKYSKSGRSPTRMKAEEKIKFVMRCLQNNVARIYSRPAAKLVNFNVKEQRSFFRRPDIRQHFLQEIPKIIKEKENSNKERIKEMESLISKILNIAKTNQKQAKNMFQHEIKQRQLPWTLDMFADIKQFCNDLYCNFIKPPDKTASKTTKSKKPLPYLLSNQLYGFLQELEQEQFQMQQTGKTKQDLKSNKAESKFEQLKQR